MSPLRANCNRCFLINEVAPYDFKHVASGHYCNDCAHTMAALEEKEQQRLEQEETKVIPRDEIVEAFAQGYRTGHKKFGCA